MTGDGKIKWRWSSKSPFGSKIPNKALIRDQSTQHCDGHAIKKRAAIGTSSDGCSNEGENARSRLKAKMRGSGSRLLSVVGFQRSSEDTKKTKELPSHTSERDVALAIVKDAATPNAPAPTYANGIHSLRPFNIMPEKIFAPRVPDYPSNTLSTLAQTETILKTVSAGSSGPPLLDPVNTHVKRKEPTGLRKSTSNPSFAHQLSHKLSETFGNPTIVHRPNLRTRPSLLSMQEEPVPSRVQSDHELSPHESNAPSSYNYSSSVSAGDPSTGKTSLESNVASLLSTKIQEGKDALIEARKVTTVETGAREKPLTPIQEAPHVVNPTVITVETTINAKIFFETYFNSLLTGNATSRSTRRRDLESRLQAQPFSEERRKFERWAWASCESDHLRQSRVLRSKTNGVSKESGVAIAGYEIVKILGKGSFGVVRLVRGRRLDLTKPTVGGLSTPAPQSWKQSPRGEPVNPKSNAIDLLKSTLEGPEAPQRQNYDKPRREVFAMKVIRKSDMLRNCQEGHLRAERDFLVAAEKSRWVVPLIASFQDNTNLYLVMEYMVGGDFLGLLFRKNILKEKHARWYIAEMILCIEETHRSRWIHRDIKPDNFLISASGHLKISDFGLAFDGHWAHDQRYYKNQRRSLMERLGIEVKGDSEDQEEDAKKKLRSNLANILTGRIANSRDNTQIDGPGEHESILQWRNRHGKRRMAASVVGTSQYMAPEVVRGDPYDGRCDYWSVGIILYECLYGFTPFVCENREDTKAKILNNTNSLVFPDEREVERREKVSFEAMELINSLLQEREHRLSSKKYRLNDWQHSRRVPGQLVARRADPLAQDYQGNFVYPDDATDIKAHPFFNRIAWDRLHLTRPPFVPDVSGGDDTKYFDEEDPVSDVDDAASEPSGDEASDEDMPDNRPTTQLATQVDGAQGLHDGVVDTAANCGAGEYNAPVYPNLDGKQDKVARAKAKKRPRDRVLRDKEVGRKALELRKKGAFLGYTYRRPKLFLFDDERERHRAARRSLLPDFD